MNIIIGNDTIKETKKAKYLGLTIQNNLKWNKQIKKQIKENPRTIATISIIK